MLIKLEQINDLLENPEKTDILFDLLNEAIITEEFQKSSFIKTAEEIVESIDDCKKSTYANITNQLYNLEFTLPQRPINFTSVCFINKDQNNSYNNDSSRNNKDIENKIINETIDNNSLNKKDLLRTTTNYPVTTSPSKKPIIYTNKIIFEDDFDLINESKYESFNTEASQTIQNKNLNDLKLFNTNSNSNINTISIRNKELRTCNSNKDISANKTSNKAKNSLTNETKTIPRISTFNINSNMLKKKKASEKDKITQKFSNNKVSNILNNSNNSNISNHSSHSDRNDKNDNISPFCSDSKQNINITNANTSKDNLKNSFEFDTTSKKSNIVKASTSDIVFLKNQFKNSVVNLDYNCKL